ncbi:hypothetical protein PbB2_01334 [Candidatus Phycosocius bacilliformis]|uniref:DUF2855 domain-containing protein n=1 Tax=Candidatus Phycosocius bacilliformis TaxID=1445552 RepID=A0A2P2E9C6_9PROT|nr:DUF2855 family protein [Candidatus Phycosocius bacilliformis]GBF57665.1 hypothetical protein PbB2_01334 [Candidatus Phycosocius bacilliformis]
MRAKQFVLEMGRQSFRDMVLTDVPASELAEGEALVAVRKFSLTANNVTYAMFGDGMKYWNFFPASQPDLGRVPVWGYGEIVESRVEGLAVGTRIYGYFPIASTLKVEPIKVSPHGFRDGAAHRQEMAAAYNHYSIVHPQDGETEGRVALLKPLFMTGFLLEDWIHDERAWTAGTVISSSASSKTALSMNACLKRRGGLTLIGLTSARSAPFVAASGYYDQVVTYDQVDQLPLEASVYVDFAGDPKVTAGVHQRLRDALKQSVIVGGAHWDAERQATPASLPGPRPQFFFAPTHMARLNAAWGAAEFTRALDAAFDRFAHESKAWLDVVDAEGFEAAQQAWTRLLDNQVSAREGLIINLPG